MDFLALYMNHSLPKLTFIIVKKRHNTRFFARDSNTGGMINVQPGTVVDTDIVHPEDFDFYLNSHAALQGRFHSFFLKNNLTLQCILLVYRNIQTDFVSCFI